MNRNCIEFEEMKWVNESQSEKAKKNDEKVAKSVNLEHVYCIYI